MAGVVDAGQAPAAAPASRTAQPVPVRGPVAAQTEEEDVTGGYDGAMFGPTLRPEEPITQGAPFGPGRSFVILPYEDERSFQLRVADQLEGSDQGGALASYIQKLRAGG